MSEVIKLKKKQVIKRKRVAAYCRVSTLNEDQNTSFSRQVAFYNQYIQSNPEWLFAGIYSDHGISGTSTNKRTGFQEMMKAAREGAIDLILTKSIKRFARNTVDLLEAVRQLKSIGVEVIFEQENISTLSADGDFMLTLLASFAQEESRNLSENIKWAFKKKFEEGDFSVKRDCYAYRWNGEQYQVIPQKAEIVRRIYREFLSGRSLMEITRQLNKEGIPAEKGGPWTFRSVRLILENISYTGNVILQKYVNVHLNHPLANKGYADQYFVPETHPAIIPFEDWEEAQAMLDKHEAGPVSSQILPFRGKVFCQKTGLPYWHNAGYWHRKDKREAYAQGNKRSSASGPDSLGVPSIPTYALEQAAKAGKGDLVRIEVKDDLSFDVFFTSGTVHGFTWKSCWGVNSPETLEARSKKLSSRAGNRWKGKSGSFVCFAKCGTCGRNYVSRLTKKGRRYELKSCRHHPYFWETEMQDLIVDVLGLDEFSEEIMDQHLSHCVINGREVIFHFWNGRTERRMLNGSNGL